MITPSRALIGAAVAATMLALVQTSAIAQSDPVGDLLQQRGESYSRAPDREQNPDEVRTTSALNAEVAAQSALADQQEAEDRVAWEDAQTQFQQQNSAAEADRMRYEADVRAAEDARLRYERDRAEWEATVEACRRGDAFRCRTGSPMYPDKPLPPGEPVG